MSNLTRDQIEALEIVDSTDGAEYSYEMDAMNALRDGGLVTFSSKRGPGKLWYRVELTELGKQALKVAQQQS